MPIHKAIVIIRIMVGCVFLSEGIQKFLFAETLGSGRFVKLGVPFPDVMGPVVGTFEISMGLLILLGLLTRFAAVPLFVIMLNAIFFTKVPQLIEKGFWITAHEGRTDFSLLLGTLFLMLVGAGSLSLDHKIRKLN